MAADTRANGDDKAGRAGAQSIGVLLGCGLRMLFTIIGRPILAVFLIVEAGVNLVADLFTRPAKARPVVKVREETVVRFDVHQRIQHILMFTTFIILAVTGLPQKFHYWDGSQWLIAAMGGLEFAQLVHRIAAFTMLFDGLYHLVYLIHTVGVRRQIGPLQMIPMPKDVLDAFQMFKYFLGMSNERPRFGRFSYLEKFDYFAVFWGIAIIGGSGLVLTFPVQVSRLLPGGIVPVAHAAHSDEALLAVGWIFIVHFFYAHFAPAVFPFNTSIFSGRVAKHRYAEEHPLEYEKLFPSEVTTHAATADNPTDTTLVTASTPGQRDHHNVADE